MFHVPVALTTARVSQVPAVVSTSRSPPGSSSTARTAVTRTGRTIGSRSRSSYAAKYRGTASRLGSSGSTGGRGMPGRSKMPLTVPMRSDSHRCCHAPPGRSSASSTTSVRAASPSASGSSSAEPNPRRARWCAADSPAWPAPTTTTVARRGAGDGLRVGTGTGVASLIRASSCLGAGMPVDTSTVAEPRYSPRRGADRRS
nr:hypothetical protein [Frigoribacterium sp. CFBP 13707]